MLGEERGEELESIQRIPRRLGNLRGIVWCALAVGCGAVSVLTRVCVARDVGAHGLCVGELAAGAGAIVGTWPVRQEGKRVVHAHRGGWKDVSCHPTLYEK